MEANRPEEVGQESIMRMSRYYGLVHCFGASSILVAFVFFSVGSFAADHKSPPTALWSWQDKHGWHFALVRDRTVPPYWSEEEVLRGSVANNLAALKKSIARLPSGTNVTWRNLPPKKTLIYPPRPLIDDVVRFAKIHHINVEVWPAVEE
jgi:hypothetical protein